MASSSVTIVFLLGALFFTVTYVSVCMCVIYKLLPTLEWYDLGHVCSLLFVSECYHRITNPMIFLCMANLDHYQCTCLDCGRKTVHPERTPTELKHSPHIEKPQLTHGFKPRTFLF